MGQVLAEQFLEAFDLAMSQGIRIPASVLLSRWIMAEGLRTDEERELRHYLEVNGIEVAS